MTNFVFGLSAAVLTAAVLFGGGARLGAPGDVVPQILSLPLLYCVLSSGWLRLREAPLLKILVVSTFGLVAVQLIPLPPSLWGMLPGRSPIVRMMEEAGIQPGWLSLSLRPQETLKVFLALLPPFALLLAVLVMDLKRRVWLIALLVGLALLNVIAGLLQLLAGSESLLYFHQFTSRMRAVGFFANPNHFTALLYSTLPFAAALMAGVSGRHVRIMAAIFAFLAFAFLVGLSISGSRTALILGGLSLVASLALLARSEAFADLVRQRSLFLAGLAAVLVAPVLMGVGLLAILDRFETSELFDDLRWQILPEALRQGLLYFPFGAGLGAFDKVYALNEPIGLLAPSFINHVHNDWMEIFYEAGAAGFFPMAVLGLIVARMCVLSIKGSPGLFTHLQAGAAIGACLLILHSLWDYPLRTEACLAVLAIAAALSVAPVHANIENIAEAVPGFGRKRRRRKSRRSSDVSE